MWTARFQGRIKKLYYILIKVIIRYVLKIVFKHGKNEWLIYLKLKNKLNSIKSHFLTV